MRSKVRRSNGENKSPWTAVRFLTPFSAALNAAKWVERSVTSLVQAFRALREAVSAAIPLPPHSSRNSPQGSAGDDEQVSHRIEGYGAKASFPVCGIFLDEPERVDGRPNGAGKLGFRFDNGDKLAKQE